MGMAWRSPPKPVLHGRINSVETICHHARARGLRPNTTYIYQVLADGAHPSGNVTTAPFGRLPFRFTSFGDSATQYSVVEVVAQRAATVYQIEQFNPLFHLHNGDLSYANNNKSSQPQVWADFMNNIQTAATRIPWMTALGNHEKSGATVRSATPRTRPASTCPTTARTSAGLAGQLVQLPGRLGPVRLP